MKITSLFIPALMFSSLIVAGCQNNATTGSSNTEETDHSITTVPEQPVNNGEAPKVGSTTPETNPVPSEIPDSAPPSQLPTSSETNDPKTGAPKQPDRVVIPKPQTSGWKYSKVDAADLGGKFDLALSKLSDVNGDFTFYYQDGTQSGEDHAKFIIGKNRKYMVEFFHANRPLGIRRIVSNGVKRQFLDEDWDIPSSTPTVWTNSDSKSVSNSWADNFPRLIFMPITDQKSIWKPLILGLKAKNYSTKVEVQNVQVLGRNRPFYRLIMTPPSSNMPTFEAKFDGIRMIPLTVNMLSVDKNGKKNQRQWTSRWEFSKPALPKEFMLPGDIAKAK